MKNKTVAAAAVLTLAIGATAACGSSGGSSGSGAKTARGPIKVWLSNNTEEVA